VDRSESHPRLQLLRELRAALHDAHLRQLLHQQQRKTFSTGLACLDALLPEGGFARGAIHELLSDPAHGSPKTFALLLARAVRGDAGEIVWSDPRRKLYPPALSAAGVPLERLLLLRPASAADEIWAIAECLACRGVAAMVAAPPKLSRVEARRIQLAAERGGGVGILLRPTGAASTHYAAATRWLVRPVPGDAAVQRWSVRLVHGHGGQVGKTIFLEVCREFTTFGPANSVRAVETLGDRPATTAEVARVSA
jgi:hypothetical protein